MACEADQNGVATFADLTLPVTANGNVTLTVTAQGAAPENSLPIPLSPAFFTTLERVSVASDGSQGSGDSSGYSVSTDGRYVAFDSRASNLVPGDTNGVDDVFVHDRRTGETTRVSIASDGSEGNYGGEVSFISADGRYVAFISYVDNLVPGDTNGYSRTPSSFATRSLRRHRRE